MNALVIYDSNFGHTKSVAEEIVKNLDGNARTLSVKNFHTTDLAGIDLVIWGSPINGWKPSVATMAVMDELPEKTFQGIKFTTFDTRIKAFLHGDAKDHIAQKIRVLGGKAIAKPKEFYVRGKDGPLFDGEIEKAGQWARQISGKA
jgi:flavodoxin